jgi:cell wall-associated NlpC family hydrolase
MLPAWAQHYVGIPYRPLGRGRDGCDCWGLLAMVWREQFGRDLPDYPGERWNEGVSAQKVADGAQTYAAQFAPVLAGQEALGDGILLRMRGHPLHVGLVLAPGWMLHTHETADSCIENYERFVWKQRVIGIYRYCND